MAEQIQCRHTEQTAETATEHFFTGIQQRQASETIQVERFSRMDRLKVPPIDFYQLKVSYQTLVTEEHPHTAQKLADERIFTEADVALFTSRTWLEKTWGTIWPKPKRVNISLSINGYI